MKIGRNSPCPCGSGKKYKKCCEDNEKNISRNVSNLLQSMPNLEGDLSRFFGYDKEARDSVENIVDDRYICMVTLMIDQKDIDETYNLCSQRVRIGEWIITRSGQDNNLFEGVFKTKDEAFKYGQKNLGVIRWLSNF